MARNDRTGRLTVDGETESRASLLTRKKRFGNSKSSLKFIDNNKLDFFANGACFNLSVEFSKRFVCDRNPFILPICDS